MMQALTEKALRVEEALSATYGRPLWTGPGEILDELVLTILSQNTSDVNSGRAFALFRERWPTMEEAAGAGEDEIAAVIAPAGLAAQKAPRIAAVLQDTRERFGAATLEPLRGWETGAVREYLLAFPGIGPKTVACVLLFSMGRPTMPVDTHVGRVAARLGLLSERASAQSAHETMDAITPPELIYPLHVGLIRHGRAVCRPANPRCDLCAVRDECVWPGLRQQPPRPSAKPPAADRPMKATRRREKGGER